MLPSPGHEGSGGLWTVLRAEHDNGWRDRP